MSVAAVMIVKDEVDVIPWTLRWLSRHVDEVLFADNGSTDGTAELVEAAGIPVSRTSGYRYSDIISALAREALARGHAWVVPVDADEVWQVEGEPRLGDWLGRLPEAVQTARGAHRNYVPTSEDDESDLCPFTRIRWREEGWGWAKVACRTRPDLVIAAGAHSATPEGIDAGGIVVRHFPYRTLEQALGKIRRGIAAYAASSDLDKTNDTHWTRWAGRSDDEIVAHFRAYFSTDPQSDDRLVYDPVAL